MPIVTNPDQSMRYEDTASQASSIAVPVVPKNNISTIEEEDAKQQLTGPTLRRVKPTPELANKDISKELQGDIGPTLRRVTDGGPTLRAVGEHTAAQNAAGGTLTGALWLPNALLTHLEAAVNIPAHKGKDGELIKPSEWAGYTEEEWDKLSYSKKKAILHEEFEQSELKMVGGADKESIPYLLGSLAGMVVSTPYPIAPAKAAFGTRTAIGAGVGAADLALYESARGQLDKGDILFGAGVGSIFGALSRGGKAYRGHENPKVRKNAQYKLTALDARIGELMSVKGANYSEVSAQALKEFKLSPEGLEVLHRDAGSSASRLPERGKRGVIDTAIEPIGIRLTEISPRFTEAIRNTLRQQMDHARQLERLMDPFTRQFSKFPGRLGSTDVPGIARDLKAALIIGDSGMLKTAMSKAGSKVAAKYRDFRKANDEIWKLLEKVRGGKNTPLGKYNEVFMHRVVKDVGEMRKWIEKNLGKAHTERIDSILKETLPEGASDAEIGRVLSRYLFGTYDSKSLKMTPSGAKSRRLTKKDFDEHPELIDLFVDPAPASNSYIKESLRDYYQKSLFGKKIVDEHGDVVNDDLFASLAKEYKVKDIDLEEFKTLLGTVFIDSVKSPHKYITNFKNLTYTGLLGNLWSAIVQTGDVVISSAIHGGVNTMEAVFQTALGRGMSPKEMGMMAALIEEFVSTGTTSKILHHALNISGFRSIDQFGKAVNMNAAVIGARKAISTPKGLRRFINEHGVAFGENFDNVLKGLQNWDDTVEAMSKIHKNMPVSRAEADMVAGVKEFAFSKLSGLQPMTVLELPVLYNRHPNFRVAYMLKTFQLKYFNALRQNFWYELKRGNRTKALHMGTGLFLAYVAGGVGTDHVKNFLLGRDNYANDIFYDNVLRAVSGPLFLDRYSSNKFMTSSDPLPKLIENVLPPAGFWSPEFVTLLRAVTPGQGMRDMPIDKMVNQIPIVGKPIYNYLMGGYEEWNAKRWEEKT